MANLDDPIEEKIEPEKSSNSPVSHRKPSNKFNIIKFEKRISATFSILYKLFVITVILVASVFVFRELSDDSYHIQQVNVPESFDRAGLSGAVVANLIQDRLADIIELLRKHDEASQYINSTNLPDVEVDMVGLGVPVRGFIALIGDALGFRKGKQINADIVMTQEKVILILRISSHPTEWFEIDLNEKDIKVSAKELVDEAAKAVLKYTDPKMLELFYSNIKHDGPNTIKMAKYMLENFADPAMVSYAYDSWAWGLLYENKFDEAGQKIQDGLKLFPNDHKLYNAWGNVLASQGKDEEAIEKFKNAFRLMPESELTTYRKVTIYVNMGISFAYLQQFDSAMQYFEKALVLDKNDWLIYYDIAGVSLLKQDTVNFYDYFERSLEKGADIEMIKKDPDVAGMLKEKRAQELLIRFSERN